MEPFIRALMEDGLDEILADWSEEDGLGLMDSEDEEDLLRASRQAEQQGGNPLFGVVMQRVQPTRTFKNGTAIQSQVRFFLQQLRDPNGELQGEAIAEAFRQGLVNFVNDPTNGVRNYEDYSLSIAIHHSSGNNLWTRARRIPLKEWMEGSEYTRAWLEQLANQLNSAQSLDATDGEFYLELTFFRTEQRGGRPGKTKLKSLSFKDILKKQSILEIKNTDNLCLARALITVKAKVDKDPQFKEIRKGGEYLRCLAHQLHEAADVPKDTCGQEELLKFQRYLDGYQIKVFDGQDGALLFNEKDFNKAPKKLCLVQCGHHFHGVTKVPALLNTSYYCHECDSAFRVEDAEHHNCARQNCDLCRRTQSKCKAFKEKQPPSLLCKDCNRKFRGPDCFAAHQRSVCGAWKKCLECCKVYKFNKKKKHQCGEYTCLNCKENVPRNHQCYIQPITEKKEEKFCRLEIPNLSAEDRELLETMQDMEREEMGGEQGEKEKPEPLVCCIDFECSLDANKEFEDVLVGWQYLNDPGSYREAGKAANMIDDVLAHTEMENGEPRQVFVFAHNMRGFDSSFILQLLYERGYEVEKILSMGAKFMSFQCGNIIFRDSLNFFNMPLERLSGTFNLQEAHKGFFPYSWICESKLSYVGPYPPTTEYNPERMNEKRRKEFLKWHQQKVESGEIFNCREELSRYLKSDVQVLTQSMETFAKQMTELTGVNPTTECVTIASTAMKVFRKNFLEPGLIALEPARGWRHNQQNQSVEALQWLEFENQKIGGGIQVSCRLFNILKVNLQCFYATKNLTCSVLR